MASKSKNLFVSVHKANALNIKPDVFGTFRRAINPQAKTVGFDGAFEIFKTDTSDGILLKPSPIFDTQGTENEDLFHNVFDNLNNPTNPSITNFRLTGSLSSDREGRLIFTYSGTLPYTEVESLDGLTTTRDVPTYFVDDADNRSATATAPPTATTTPATTSTTSAVS